MFGMLRPQQAAGEAGSGPVATNAPAVDAGTIAPQIAPEPHVAPCACDDEETDRLREMVAGGMEQWDASREIWGESA